MILIQTFAWTSPEGDLELTFPVSAMLYDMARGQLPYELVTTAVSREFAEEWVLPHRDIKMDRVQTILDNPTLYNEPVLGAHYPDGTVILIDGSHRYIAHYIRCDPDIDYRLLAYSDWRPYATVTKGALPL